MISSLSRQITNITVLESLSSLILVLVGSVIIINSPTLPPPSSSLFHKLHLLDLDCCDGCRGWGGSLMLVLLDFVLGFGSNNFGGCRG